MTSPPPLGTDVDCHDSIVIRRNQQEWIAKGRTKQNAATAAKP